MSKILLFFMLFGSSVFAQNQDSIVFSDTLFSIVSDSFLHRQGKVLDTLKRLQKPFRYIGEVPAFIVETFTQDPHFICRYPKEPLLPGKTYWFTVCFWLRGRGGAYKKPMGFVLSNGERITFTFTGFVEAP